MNIPKLRCLLTAALLTPLLVPMTSVHAAVVFSDDFTNFVMGARWQPHGAGTPDLVTGIVGLGTDGSSLRMGSSPGVAGEIVGIEPMVSFPLTGARAIRVTARVRPLNQTGSGDGGCSDASVGISINAEGGIFTRVSAAANRASAPDWADFYYDSDTSFDGGSVAFAHFPPNDPNGGAEAFRTFVLEVRTNGTSMTALSSTGQPLAATPFTVFNPNLTLANFGTHATVALFQQRSDANAAPENSFGDVDSITVEIEGDVVTLLDDPFEPAGAGPGANWEPAATGLPNSICDRIALDAGHSGLRMGSQDPTGAPYGVQLANPLLIPQDATGLEIDFLVQPRNGGEFDARLALTDLGDNDSLAVSFNEFSGGQVRRIAVLGNAAGKSFDKWSASDYAFSPYTFYHVAVSVKSAGTTVKIQSEDLATTIDTFSIPDLTITNLAGATLRLAILQADADNTVDGGTSPECFADRLTVRALNAPPAPLVLTISQGGDVINDSKPGGVSHDGVNIGASWLASSADATPVTRIGVMQFSASRTNQLTLAGDADFNSPTGTILFWLRSAGAAGAGSEGAMLFDRRPRHTNGPPGAVLAQMDAGHLLFQAASGQGLGGLPNEVSDRIKLDDAHSGFRMRANDLSGMVFGIQLATPLDIPPQETSLGIEWVVQNRSGGAFPARLLLEGGADKSLSITMNEFPGGPPRQCVVSGRGGAGAFSVASDEYAQSPYNFYHLTVAVSAEGVAVDLMAEDMSPIHTFTIPEFKVGDLAGYPLQVKILQAANTGAGATESLVDHLQVNSGTASVLLDDPFEPPGAGPGILWVAAAANGLANEFQSLRTINDNRWHQVALVYDQAATGTCELYIDGVLDSSLTNSAAWSWVPDQIIELGRSHNPQWKAFDGQFDDFRLYSRRLSPVEIGQAAASGNLVDPAALMVRFNFDAPPSGLTLSWPGTATLESSTDFTTTPVWTALPGARSPHYIRTGEAALRFYRAVGF